MYNDKIILLKGKYFLKFPKKKRTEDIINSIIQLCKLFKPFIQYLNEKDKKALEEILYTISLNLNYKEMKCGTFIKKFGEDDKMFYIIVKGLIGKFTIKYTKYSLSKTNYCIHLMKLKLLNEFYLFNECYENNKNIITLPDDILSCLKQDKRLDCIDELNKIKKKIQIYTTYKNFQLSDFLNLYNVEIHDKSILDNEKESFFQLMIPEYEFSKFLSFGNKIGVLKYPKHFKSLYAYVNLTNSQIVYLEKDNIDEEMVFWKKIHSSEKNWLEKILPSFFIFDGVKLEFIKKNFIPYFQYFKIKKGEYLIKRKSIHYGIYFIINGIFDITTILNYDEIDDIIHNLKHSLDNFPNYETDLKQDNKYMINNPILNSKGFGEKKKIKKEILILETTHHLVLGLNEFLEYKTKLNQFSVICKSDEADVFFAALSIESMIYNSIDIIKNNAAKLIEKNAKYFIKTLEVYKLNFIKEYELFERKCKSKNSSLLFPFLKNNSSSQDLFNTNLFLNRTNSQKIIFKRNNFLMYKSSSSPNLNNSNEKIKRRIKEVMNYLRNNKIGISKTINRNYLMLNKEKKEKKNSSSFILSSNLKINKFPFINEKINAKLKQN